MAMELYYTSKNKRASESSSTEIGSLEYGSSTNMATGGYGDYDDATANQDWTEYYPTSSESYSSSWYSQKSSDPSYKNFSETSESQLASGDVSGLAQQTTAPQYSWPSQSGQATSVRASLRPAAPRPRAPAPGTVRPGTVRPGAPTPGAVRPGAPRPGALRLGAQQVGMRPTLPPQASFGSLAKMVLQQHLHMVDKVPAASHPTTAQYEHYYEGESDYYGESETNASTAIGRGSAAVALRPRIPSVASGSRLAMSRPGGPCGPLGWPGSMTMQSPRLRPASNRFPVSTFGSGARGPARSVAPGTRAAGPGIRTALAPRVTARGARGMPAASAATGVSSAVRAVGAGPRGARAPGARTSFGPRPSLIGLNVRQPTSQAPSALGQPTSREPSAFQSRLTQLAQSSCDELGISKTTDAFGSQAGDNKAEASAINEEEEDDDDDDDDVDPNSCKLCDVKFEKSQAYHVHIRSTSHNQKLEARKKEKKALAGGATETPSSMASAPANTSTAAVQPSAGGSGAAKKGEHFCYVCNFLFSNAEMFNSHLTGMLHVQRLEEQKTSKPSMIDEEEGDEDSQDSTVTTSFKKIDWKSVSEKDLNPDDIGKPGSAQFFCEVCNVTCTGQKSYEMHIVGSKHLKKLKKAKEIENFEQKKQEGGLVNDDLLKSKKKRKVVRVQEILDQCSEPLIGLDYMTEFQVEDVTVEPRYICDLCQCKMDMRQIIPHVTGIKHRQKYFKYHSVREYNILWDIRRKSEKVRAATKFAAETEAREGRHKMRLKIQLKPFDDEDSKGKDGEEWLELEDAHSRPKSALPGLGGFSERSAAYKDVSEYEEDEESERDDGPVLDVDELRRMNPPYGQGRGRSGAGYQPPPPTRFRPGAPSSISRPPSFRPRGHRPPGPPRSLYPLRETAPRLPAARGYPPEVRRAPAAAADPYYQRYPGYSGRYDYYHPTPPSASSSSSLETRAVINYDHQSLATEGDDYGATSTYTESSTRARQEPDHHDNRAASMERGQHSAASMERGQHSAASMERGQHSAASMERGQHSSASMERGQHSAASMERGQHSAASVERSPRSAASVERSRQSAANDGDSNISNINIDLVKAAIGQCNIDTEADAEIALQISNSLTQALLEYRLNSLAKAGTSDAALEQHLTNLRQQNAEHLTAGHHPETSNLMSSALRATRALASKLPDGDQETIKQAMSVLDEVNLQLYGMLDKGGDSAKTEAPQKRQEPAAAVGQVEQQQASREMRQEWYEQRDEEPSGGYRQMGSAAASRPPSKRFRFGL